MELVQLCPAIRVKHHRIPETYAKKGKIRKNQIPFFYTDCK